jgi:hypothetical protein
MIDWLRRQRLTIPKLTELVYYDRQSGAPASLPRHVIAVIGTYENPKWATFECPCGTGHTIMVNLSRERRPSWSLSVGKDGPSLSPSIDFQDSYTHCHFWLQDGRVRFTPDSRRRRRQRHSKVGQPS